MTEKYSTAMCYVGLTRAWNLPNLPILLSTGSSVSSVFFSVMLLPIPSLLNFHFLINSQDPRALVVLQSWTSYSWSKWDQNWFCLGPSIGQPFSVTLQFRSDTKYLCVHCGRWSASLWMLPDRFCPPVVIKAILKWVLPATVLYFPNIKRTICVPTYIYGNAYSDILFVSHIAMKLFWQQP